jgi:hypothetical protein
MKYTKTLLALAACIANTAIADVTYDPETGQGYVGRGDVIEQLGKEELVANPTIEWRVAQEYEVSLMYSVEETSTNKQGKEITKKVNVKVTEETTALSTSTIEFETKTAKGKRETQITGYILNASDTVTTSNAPEEGSTMTTQDQDGEDVTAKVTAVAAVGEPEVGLYFNNQKLELSPVEVAAE